MDRALPAARHRAGVVRGLDLARVLRARARGDLRPHLAQRRARRAAAARSGATSPGRSTRPARRSIIVRAAPTTCARSTTSAVTAATSWCGRTTRARRRAGTCRQFTCKYHGWRYGLEGDLTFVQQEGEFFDLDKADYGLAPVRVETWEGFIFVNLDTTDTTPLRDYLGELGKGLEGYPFGEMTQVYKYRAEVGSNWKLFIDAFTEFYHAPVLHARQAVSEESQKLAGLRLRSARVRASTVRTGWCRRGAACRRRRTSNMVKPIERVLHSGLFGPWDAPDRDRAAAGGQPGAAQAVGRSTRSCSSPTSWCSSGSRTGTSRTTTGRRRTTRTSSRARCYFVPPKNARERLAQELAAVTFKEYALQDGNTLEATQTMLESRAGHLVPAGDQEILLRQLHHTTARVRSTEYEKSERLTMAAPLPDRLRRPRAVRRLVPRVRARALRQATRELDGRDAGVLRRRVPAARSGDGVPRPVPDSTRCPTTPATCCGSATRS